jgi:hypothetical protein
MATRYPAFTGSLPSRFLGDYLVADFERLRGVHVNVILD